MNLKRILRFFIFLVFFGFNIERRKCKKKENKFLLKEESKLSRLRLFTLEF
jgi:hypothetical protein